MTFQNGKQERKARYFFTALGARFTALYALTVNQDQQSYLMYNVKYWSTILQSMHYPSALLTRWFNKPCSNSVANF